MPTFVVFTSWKDPSNVTTDNELGITDGTSTTILDIRTGEVNSSVPTAFVQLGNKVFFQATNGTNGFELWSTDGTLGGTQMFLDINPTGSAFQPGNSITDGVGPLPLVIGNVMYFRATNGLDGVELWKTDGTLGGTGMVKNIRAGANGSLPSSYTDVNGVLFFVADDGGGLEVWKSDGTNPNTTEVTSFAGGTNPGSLLNFNGRLVYTGTDDLSGRPPLHSRSERRQPNAADGRQCLDQHLRGALGQQPVLLWIASWGGYRPRAIRVQRHRGRRHPYRPGPPAWGWRLAR